MGGYVYITKQGDMWDYIAWKVYGDEAYVNVLYRANTAHLDTYIFEDGCEIYCPPVRESGGDEIEEKMPDWRDNEDLEDDDASEDEEDD